MIRKILVGVGLVFTINSVNAETDYCSRVKAWNKNWEKLELEVIQQVNSLRKKGVDCKKRGKYKPTQPLKPQPKLTCAARNHAEDMAKENYLSHRSPSGSTPASRLKRSQYDFRAWGENIAAGCKTASCVVTQWVQSPNHCANLMNSKFAEIGVGYFHKEAAGRFQDYWVQNFAAPFGGLEQ